jgi:hypothetical protein
LPSEMDWPGNQNRRERETMTVLNRIGDRLARIVLPKAEAAAQTCGQYCFCYKRHVYRYSCLNHGCVYTGSTC